MTGKELAMKNMFTKGFWLNDRGDNVVPYLKCLSSPHDDLNKILVGIEVRSSPLRFLLPRGVKKMGLLQIELIQLRENALENIRLDD